MGRQFSHEICAINTNTLLCVTKHLSKLFTYMTLLSTTIELVQYYISIARIRFTTPASTFIRLTKELIDLISRVDESTKRFGMHISTEKKLSDKDGNQR